MGTACSGNLRDLIERLAPPPFAMRPRHHVWGVLLGLGTNRSISMGSGKTIVEFCSEPISVRADPRLTEYSIETVGLAHVSAAAAAHVPVASGALLV